MIRNSFKAVLLTMTAILPVLAVQAQSNSLADAGEPAIDEAEVAASLKNNSTEDRILPGVVVTGTSIRGVAPVGSPLLSKGRDDLESTSAVTIADYMLSVPQLQQGRTIR